MKKILYIIAAAAALLAAASCSKTEQNSPSKSGRRIHLTVKAEKPALTDEAGTKVTFSGEKLVWDGTEKMQVIIGNSSSTTAETGRQVELDQVSEGVFDGFIDLGEYTEEDIQAIVVGPASYYNYNSGQRRVTMPVRKEQVQKESRVMNGENFPIFAVFDPSYIGEEDGNDVLMGAQLNWGCAVMQYTVYGGDAAMNAEKVESIKITADKSGTAGLYGSTNYRINGGATTFAGTLGTSTVTLETPEVPGNEYMGGVVFYQAVEHRADGTNDSKHFDIRRISVCTDKAVYTKDFEAPKEISLKAGQALPVKLDLSTFTRVGNIEYSTDGGQTWEPEIPAAQSFSTLAVRSAVALSNEDLSAIAEAVKAQSGLVDLDLSRSTISNTVTIGEDSFVAFPVIFGSTTAANAVANLRSIKFPSNTKGIVGNAFINCSGLQSVDLTGIQFLSTAIANYSAFSRTGLTSLVIPSTMTGMMDRSFCSLFDLESIYYDAAWNPGTSQNWRTFQWGTGNNSSDTSADGQHEKTKDLTLTVGPNAVAIPLNAFRNNHNLTKVVAEGSDNLTFLGECFMHCDNLAEFDLQGEYPPKISSYSVYSTRSGAGTDADPYVYTPQIGTSVAATGRKIYVPAGKLYVYQSHANWPAWEDMAARCGYEIIDPDPVVVEAQYSADGSTWSTAIPATFTTLYVKGIATADDLDAVKAAIDAQGTAVSLDMSQAQYGASTFPKLFAGTGTSAKYTKLKSIKFPSNVKTIAAQAFRYSEIETVDLTGIESIGEYAFQYTDLKDLVVPSSVTTLGTNVFSFCWKLETVYYDSPANTARINTFACRNNAAADALPDAYKAENIIPLTLTVGPNGKIGDYDFDTNHKLTTLVIKDHAAAFKPVGSNWIIRARLLSTIDLSDLTVTPNIASTSLGNVGDLVTGTKKIIVPAGKAETFGAVAGLKYLVDSKGFTIVEAE